MIPLTESDWLHFQKGHLIMFSLVILLTAVLSIPMMVLLLVINSILFDRWIKNTTSQRNTKREYLDSLK